MNKLISFFLAILLCLSCLVPAFALDAAVQEQNEAQDAETTAAADPEFLEGEYNTLQSQYAEWKSDRGENARYHRAYRQFYATDPDLTIVGHMVFQKHEKKRWSEAYYALLDYFDTDEAEALAWTMRIPSEVNGLPVSLRIYGDDDYADGFFYNGYNNDTVRKIILDEGFTYVDSFAFTNFTSLWSVRIPKTVTTVGYGAFRGCRNLSRITGGEGITTVLGLAFSGCEKLASFPHMETLKTIEGDAFSGCGFKKLTLSGNAWLSCGDEDNYSAWRAFADNKKLTSVVFLDGSKKKNLVIGFSTFWGCTALKTVVFPKKCKEIVIEDNAFYGCTSLKWPGNPEKITEIWRFAFAGCTSLEHVMLPAGIKVVSEDAFKDCKNLKSLDLRSENIDLLSRRCDSGTSYQTDDYNGVSTNFVKFLPKTCTVYVANKDMKVTVKAHGCKGKVQIKVPVGMPKNIRAEKKGKNYTLKWSKVKNADGYRVYFYPYTGKRTYKNVRGGAAALTLKNFSPEKYHSVAVKAFRVVDGDVSWGTPLFGAPGAMEKK